MGARGQKPGKEVAAAVTIAICSALFLCGLLAIAVQRGLREVESASMLRNAGQEWQEGQYFTAVLQVFRAYSMALDGGIRHLMVDAIYQMPKSKDLHTRLAICQMAARILGRYDSEGSQSFACRQIEDAIKIERCKAECEEDCRGYGIQCTP